LDLEGADTVRFEAFYEVRPFAIWGIFIWFLAFFLSFVGVIQTMEIPEAFCGLYRLLYAGEY
jgi:hypothetical protein